MAAVEYNKGGRKKKEKQERKGPHLLGKANLMLLGQVRVQLNLIDGRLDAAVGQQVCQQLDGKVADANMPHKAGINQSLHGCVKSRTGNGQGWKGERRWGEGGKKEVL